MCASPFLQQSIIINTDHRLVVIIFGFCCYECICSVEQEEALDERYWHLHHDVCPHVPNDACVRVLPVFFNCDGLNRDHTDNG